MSAIKREFAAKADREVQLELLHLSCGQQDGPLENYAAARMYLLAARRFNDELHECWASDKHKAAQEALDQHLLPARA